MGRQARARVRAAVDWRAPGRVLRPGGADRGGVRRRRDPRLVAGSQAGDLPRRQGGRGRMIGMVLAAGAGKRLGSLTEDLPKTLLEVDSPRTILDIALGNFAAVGPPGAASLPGLPPQRVGERPRGPAGCLGAGVPS